MIMRKAIRWEHNAFPVSHEHLERDGGSNVAATKLPLELEGCGAAAAGATAAVVVAEAGSSIA